MRRLLGRRWGAFFGAMIASIVLIFAFAMLLTQTNPGRERVLAITLETLGGQLSEGSLLRVGRLEGGLFTGARMYDIELRDPAGQRMVRADSAFIDYRLGTFFGGDVVINALVLYNGEVLLYRMPGDSLWNYQAVLQDTTPSEPGRRGRATILHAMRLVNSVVTVRLPWEPSEDVTGAAREAEIAAALSDTSRIAVEQVPGGFLRTIVTRTPDLLAEDVTVAPTERGGTYLRIARGEAEVDFYRDEPIRVTAMEGDLSLLEGVMRYRLPRLEFPDSRLATSGVIDMSGEAPSYDLRMDAANLALRDVRWLHPPLPEEGEASFSMQLETRPGEMLIRTDDLDLTAPGTRLVGDFSLSMGDALLFSNVSLRADPLDVDTVEQMLPTAIPVRGLEIGSVEIESVAS